MRNKFFRWSEGDEEEQFSLQPGSECDLAPSGGGKMKRGRVINSILGNLSGSAR